MILGVLAFGCERDVFAAEMAAPIAVAVELPRVRRCLLLRMLPLWYIPVLSSKTLPFGGVSASNLDDS